MPGAAALSALVVAGVAARFREGAEGLRAHGAARGLGNAGALTQLAGGRSGAQEPGCGRPEGTRRSRSPRFSRVCEPPGGERGERAGKEAGRAALPLSSVLIERHLRSPRS